MSSIGRRTWQCCSHNGDFCQLEKCKSYRVIDLHQESRKWLRPANVWQSGKNLNFSEDPWMLEMAGPSHRIFSREKCKHQVDLAQERSYTLLRKQAGGKRLSKVIRAQKNLSWATDTSHKAAGSVVSLDFSPALAILPPWPLIISLWNGNVYSVLPEIASI